MRACVPGTHLRAMQLGKVGPAGHWVEVWLRVDQFHHSFTSVVRQSWGACIQHLHHLVCVTMPACTMRACSGMLYYASVAHNILKNLAGMYQVVLLSHKWDSAAKSVSMEC